jgi:lysophospholipase L1-like esterase
MDDLKQRHPEVAFVHVTAPLRTVDRGAGVWVRERIGRRNRSKHANARRGEFNRLLRVRYAGEPVFDLAACQSTPADGRCESFRLEGAEHHALVPAYTDDGGHLNEAGRRHIAAEFIHAIAAALASRMLHRSDAQVCAVA